MSQRLIVTGSGLAVILLLSLGSIFATTTVLSNSDQTLILAATALALYLTVLGLNELHHKEAASPLAIFAALCLAHFALPSMFLSKANYPGNHDYYLQAIIYVALCVLFFHAGYTLTLKSFGGKVRTEARSWSPLGVFLVIAALFALGWLARGLVIHFGAYLQASLIELTSDQPRMPAEALLRLLETLPDAAATIALIQYYDTERGAPGRGRRWWLLFWLLFITSMAYWLPTGRKYPTILAVLIPLVVRYLMTKRIPSFKTIMLAGAFVMALFPATHIYRMAQRNFANPAEVQGLSATIELAISSFADFERLQREGQIGAGGNPLGRFDLTESIAAAIRIIDEDIWELRLGQNYLNGAISLVPRFILPDKPEFAYGNAFGNAASMIGRYRPDRITSISVTLPGEAFLNFGWFGTLFMAVFGSAYALLYRLHLGAPRSPTRLLLYVTAVPTMLYIGATFALYYSTLARLLVLFWVLGKFMEIRWQQAPLAAPPLPLPPTRPRRRPTRPLVAEGGLATAMPAPLTPDPALNPALNPATNPAMNPIMSPSMGPAASPAPASAAPPVAVTRPAVRRRPAQPVPWPPAAVPLEAAPTGPSVDQGVADHTQHDQGQHQDQDQDRQGRPDQARAGGDPSGMPGFAAGQIEDPPEDRWPHRGAGEPDRRRERKGGRRFPSLDQASGDR